MMKWGKVSCLVACVSAVRTKTSKSFDADDGTVDGSAFIQADGFKFGGGKPGFVFGANNSSGDQFTTSGHSVIARPLAFIIR